MNNNHRNEPGHWADNAYNHDSYGQQNYRSGRGQHYPNQDWQEAQNPNDWQSQHHRYPQQYRNEYPNERPGRAYGNSPDYRHEWDNRRQQEHHDRGYNQSHHSQQPRYAGRYNNQPDFYQEPYARTEHFSGAEQPYRQYAREDYRPQHQEPHEQRHTSLGVAAVGGSFTSYSASRSRRGSMGHSSSGALHREGPGMNSYYRGDINANSNW